MKNESFKKLTDEARAEITKAIVASADLIAKTKAASDADSGTFKVIISTANMDRQGESVDQAGMDLTFFKTNPVVLWAHDYASLPIGVCTNIETVGDKTIAEGKFAPADANIFAQSVRKLYDLGMVNTVSVGFIPKEFGQKDGATITKSELLEFSFVPVPANPYALRLNQVKEMGLDTAMLKTKGIEIEVKEDAPVEPIVTPEAPVEPAKPVEGALVEDKKAKGEVAQEVSVIESRQQKWAKYMEVCEIMDAFCNVYFDEATPVEDFKTLFTETIALMQDLTSSDGMDADDAMKAKKAEGMKKLLRGKTQLNIKDAVNAVLRNHIALGSIALSEGKKDGKEAEAIIQRSKIDEGMKELNVFVETRSLLRIADNAIEKVLRNFNSAARNQ